MSVIFKPRDIVGLMAFMAVEPDRPGPLVVEGSPEEWREGVSTEAVTAIAQSPVATIAIVNGPLAQSSLLDAFDLVAIEPRDDGSRVQAWIGAFAKNPQAATVLMRLLREPTHTLHRESLAYSLLQSGREFREWLARNTAVPAGDTGPRVLTSVDQGVAEIVLNRPAKRNAFDALMREELCDALDAAAASAIRRITLRGEGENFSSGGDLGEFGLLVDPVNAHLIRTSRSVPVRLEALRLRLVAAIHGACVGGGVEFAAFAAKVIAEENATFRLPEVGFGLIPGAGGTISVPRRIGKAHFLDLALTGKTIDARTALAWGLIDEMVPAGTLRQRLASLV